MFKPRNENSEKKNIRVIPIQECLAKTIRDEPVNRAGVSVAIHCRIVGYVAKELIRRMPKWLRERYYPEGSELIAAVHDIGKISPTFQERIHRDLGQILNITNPDLDKVIGYHFTVSQAAADGCPKYIPEILGRHHGRSPSSIQSADAEIYGGHEWQKKRMDLMNDLKKEMNTDWPAITSSIQADAIAGLTTVADWIGSGSLFDTVDEKSWKSKIDEALDRAGFVTPQLCVGLNFKDVFGFSPYPLQMCFIESIKKQGAYVLEAPMGAGKTEAALYAAYKMLEKGDATGIYFALPTQLTSDKVYERVNLFLAGDPKKNLQGILEASDPWRSALLLHGSAWLRETELGEEGNPGKSWFSSGKRGLLAPFAVGTIDQALMAVMNVRHGFVRTFGLAGKVVILDEVHSYDSYTGTILKELVTALRELHCTVIILSATLTDNQRRSILGAAKPKTSSAKLSAYPLISQYPIGGKLKELETEKNEEFEVNIHICSDDNKAIDEALKRAERGEQILWIENTVDDAQRRYRELAAMEMNLECGLLHSRFIKVDRRKNEDKWVGLFGTSGREKRREKGRILIGTQVLEQSLDIDADFLVSRLCPTDMLFQRLGRLWRHRDNDSVRPDEAQCEAWILAPEMNQAILDIKHFGKYAKVYSPYVLCRTLEVWQSISSIKLPGDIRPLLEATYKERSEKGRMATYKQEMIKQKEKLTAFALTGISRGGQTLPESKASTRYSEIESIEVLLIKKIIYEPDGIMLHLLDDTKMYLPKKAEPSKRRKRAATLLNNTVSVPEYLAPTTYTKQLAFLKEYVYLGNHEESPFRASIVSDSDELQGLGQTEVSEKYHLEYDACLGYRAEKKGR
ncbi:CRISPR-associated helicase Cas3' [bacterium]|nr:CRISPR-associated helicase Cas3' [bacterium]